MRTSVDLGRVEGWCFAALGEQETFLYRRVMDGDREVLGVGGGDAFIHADTTLTLGVVFDRWKEWWETRVQGEWCFGHVAYDAKNGLEDLVSQALDPMAWPDVCWFIPRWVFEIKGGQGWLHAHPEDIEEGLRLAGRLLNESKKGVEKQPVECIWVEPDKARYLREARHLLRRIHRGDIYEINHCVEWMADAMGWDPHVAFQSALTGSQAPYAGYYRLGERYALCFSPERFLKWQPGLATTEPMKGTRPRHPDPERDLELALELAADEKERSENIMAVDVARHDLSRVAAHMGVKVEELCAIRSYPAVHQMVSTVQCRTAPGVGVVDVVRACFPPASMTGAPKISAMRLIDQAEGMRRGLFAGVLGFVDPEGLGDLNVVIRTLQFRADTGRLSLMTGSALTALSDPDKEWEECSLKAASVLRYLSA